MTTHHTARRTRTVQGAGYRYIPSVFQFSGGVAAEPGHSFERVVFGRPVPLETGLELVQRRLRALGRPSTAFCACELRSPGQFAEADFAAFNRRYASVLDQWGLMDGDVNPVARTNVCPETAKPDVPSMHAFVYTIPSADAGAVDFVTAGGAEAPEGDSDYHGGIVRPGDTSLDGLREKLGFVRDEQTTRLVSLGHDWDATSEVNAYCLHDVGPLLYSELISRGASSPHEGVTVLKASPPVADCDFEMDTRRITSTLVADRAS